MYDPVNGICSVDDCEDISDEAKLAHAASVISEDINKPLIGEVESIDTLIEEYRGHPQFRAKLQHLRQHFKSFRRVRRDGSCFYRAFCYWWVNFALSNKDKAKDKVCKFLTSSLDDLVRVNGYTETTIDDFLETFIDAIREAPKEVETSQEDRTRYLQEQFNDLGVSNAIVVYARILTGAYLKQKAEDFSPYHYHPSMDAYVQAEVNPLQAEAEHLQILALATVTSFPISIAYLDGSPGLEPTFITLPERTDETNAATTPYVPSNAPTLLYRPGHYDLLLP